MIGVVLVFIWLTLVAIFLMVDRRLVEIAKVLQEVGLEIERWRRQNERRDGKL